MPEKEATLVQLDVGACMNHTNRFKNKSYYWQLYILSIIVDCIGLMIQQTIFNYKNHEDEDRKTFLYLALIISRYRILQNFDRITKLQYSFNKSNIGQSNKHLDENIFIFTEGFGLTEYNEKQIEKLIQMNKIVDKYLVIKFQLVVAIDCEKSRKSLISFGSIDIARFLIRQKTSPKLVVQSLFKMNHERQNNYQK